MPTLRLDPRTTLALLVVGNVVMFSVGLSGTDAIVRGIFMVIPVVLALLAGRWRVGLAYVLVSGVAFGVETATMSGTFGVVGMALGGGASLVARVLPAAMMGYVALVTISVSDLMAALERWRLPEVAVIPLAVVLRFLPTAFEENRAIAQAVRVRTLTPRAVGLSAWVEYRTVPLVVATVNAGEELAQAGLTRGVGAPVRPTRLANVGFRPYDAVMLALAVAGVGLWVWG